MKTFENRSIEMAHLESTRSTFKARLAARSLFRLFLKGIQEKGFFYTHQALLQVPKEIALPIPGLDGELSGLEIVPIDHKFNLYWWFRSSSISESTYALSIFTNIINQIKDDRKKDSRASSKLTKEEIAPVVADIYDWQDKDGTPNLVNEEYGIEEYSQEDILFQVKNRNFDILAELKLVPKFQNLKITSKEIDQHFKVNFNKDKSFVNVNIATKEEILEFLKRFEGVDGYDSLFEDENLRKLLSKKELGIRKYETYDSLFEDLNEALSGSANGIDAIGTSAEPTFFKIKSDYISIQYKVHMNQTTLRVKAIVEITYKSADSFDISSFTIHQFRII